MPLGRVLVVDDEPEIVEVLRDLVDGLGYEVNAATSVREAIAAMAIVRPHVVFLDIRMPGISGLEALAYFREHDRRIPVIVVTALIDEATLEQARAGGAFDVVAKPFALASLTRLLAEALKVAPRE
jgi:CheY-like chemotaxis protein